MTKQKKILLICGISLTPLPALLALVLRAIALFTEYEPGRGYFMAASPVYQAFLWTLAVGFFLFFLFSIISHKDMPASGFRNSLSILFSAAFFAITLAISAFSCFLNLNKTESGLEKFFWIAAACSALLSLLYFGLFFYRHEAHGAKHGLLSLAPAFYALFAAMLLYLDHTTQMNDPAKLLHLAALLSLACYFLAEGRGFLDRPKRASYYFVTASTLLLTASASLPNLIYNIVNDRILVLSSTYDFVLFAATLYMLARLLQLLPTETPSVHRMVEQFLHTTAHAVAEEEAEPDTAESAAVTPEEITALIEEPKNEE